MTLRDIARASLLVTALACTSDPPDASPPPPPPFLPPPTISRVAPRLIVPGSITDFGIEGNGFARRDSDVAPTMTVSRTRDVDGNATDGPSLSVEGYVQTLSSVVQRSFMWIDAPTLEPGVYAVALRNEEGLEARYEDAFVLPPPPAITAIEDRFCLAGAPAPTIAIEGVNFYQPAPYVAAVYLHSRDLVQWGDSSLDELAVESVSGCRPVPFALEGLELCARIVARLPDRIAGPRTDVILELPHLPPEWFDLVRPVWIEQPMTTSAHLGFGAAVDAPRDARVWDRMVVHAPAFTPSVSIGDVPLAVRPGGCVPSGVPSFELCSELTATIPQGFAPGNHTIEVTTANGCTGTASIVLGPRPVISSLSTPLVCERTQRLRVDGDGFFWPEVIAGSDPELRASSYHACTPGSGAPMCLGVDGDFPVGVHELRVRNQTAPPVVSNAVQLTVAPGPPMVGDPRERVLYSGATRPVFVPAWGITGEVVAADLVPHADGTEVDPPAPLPVDVVAVAGGVEVTFPALGGDGDYHVVVHDGSPCPSAQTFSPFHVVADPVLLWQDFDGPQYPWFFTQSPVAGTAPAFQVLWGDGVAGNAGGASRDVAGPEWFFTSMVDLRGADLGMLRFDLRASGSGEASGSRGVVLFFRSSPAGRPYQLERHLPAPAPGAWTHFDVALDDASGWTYHEPFTGVTRPAARDDLRGELGTIWILGSWWTGATSAALDDFTIELAR